MIRIILLVQLCTLLSVNSFSQDFYLESSTQARSIYKGIDPNWESLTESEARDFLISSNFSNIKSHTESGVKMFVGEYKYGNIYIYHRILMFKDYECIGFTDLLQMVRECSVCMTSSLNVNDPYVGDLNRKNKIESENFDTTYKQLFIEEIKKSFKKDGITEPLSIYSYQDNFNVLKEIYNGRNIILREAKLKLEKSSYAYIMTVSKTILSNITDVKVMNISLKNVDTYDLKEMLNIFLFDCYSHDIEFQESTIIMEFVNLNDGVLGVSYGKDNDKLIHIEIDPEKWQKSSKPKKWYLLYHELGHDALNLSHGNGGKMMFNFADKTYTWEEFLEDKENMFRIYKNNN